MSQTKIDSEARTRELDEYAGVVARLQIDAVTDYQNELSVGDVVAAKRGKARQGVVAEVGDGFVRVDHPSGGFRTYHFESNGLDSVDRFSLTGSERMMPLCIIEN